MPKHRVDARVPDWYIRFQQAVFAALPRPPQLSEEAGLRWANNLKSLSWVLAEAILFPEGIRPPRALFRELRTFKTIGRGRHARAESSREALQAAGCRFSSSWGTEIAEILERADFSRTGTIDLVVVSTTQIGYPFGATRRKIYERALLFGLEEVPHWGGPALREVYSDQPRGEWLYIATEPIVNSEGIPHVFSVAHTADGLVLDVSRSDDDDFCSNNECWVFTCRRF